MKDKKIIRFQKNNKKKEKAAAIKVAELKVGLNIEAFILNKL